MGLWTRVQVGQAWEANKVSKKQLQALQRLPPTSAQAPQPNLNAEILIELRRLNEGMAYIASD